MAEMIQHASDDQIALAICFGAVTLCGLIMYFSHHVGRLTGHIRLHDGADQPARSTRRVTLEPASANVARDRAA